MQSFLSTDRYTKLILTAIAFLLGVIAFRPMAQPRSASAATSAPASSWYVEPGVTSVRSPDGSQQVDGKVMIDLRNGDIWGFPTLSRVPYPVNPVQSKGPVSSPIYLGKFDFSKVTPSQP